jgi:hypothetical protein
VPDHLKATVTDVIKTDPRPDCIIESGQYVGVVIEVKPDEQDVDRWRQLQTYMLIANERNKQLLYEYEFPEVE